MQIMQCLCMCALSEFCFACCVRVLLFYVKVTVQFETEGNGQNEIVSHMDRSDVKL